MAFPLMLTHFISAKGGKRAGVFETYKGFSDEKGPGSIYRVTPVPRSGRVWAKPKQVSGGSLSKRQRCKM